MKLAVQTTSLPVRFGIDGAFRMLRDTGFDGVDFNLNRELPCASIENGEYSGLFTKSDDEIIEFVRPYKEAGEKYGVSFHQMHAPYPSYVANEAGNDIVINGIRKCIMTAGYLNCQYLVVHPMFLPYSAQLDPQAEWELNIERYSLLIPDAKRYGVTICLENMFTCHNGTNYAACCSDMAVVNRYIERLNSIAGEKLFGFCLDVGHALVLGQDIYSTIMKLGGNLTTLHVHDNNGRIDQHLYPYMGVCDWDRFCRGLKDAGYTGAISFETFNTMNMLDDELVADSLRFLSAIGRMFARRVAG